MSKLMCIHTGSVDTKENWEAEFNEHGQEWYESYLDVLELVNSNKPNDFQEIALSFEEWLKKEWSYLKQVN